MDAPASLLDTLRARLRDVQTKLVELNALRREEESLSSLIRHYESLATGLDGAPDAIGPETQDETASSFSLPRRMTVAVRKLLSTDVGPEATVPELFAALPKSLRSHYKAPTTRSNVETLRTQILTWKDEIGLVYSDGGKVSTDPNAVPALFRSNELVLRTGPYRCSLHPSVRKEFRQEKLFDLCSMGPECSWEFAQDRPIQA